MIRITGFLLGAALALLMTNSPPAEAQWGFGGGSLDEIENRLERKHDDIEHITAEKLLGMGVPGQDFLLLDVRKKSEFEVSHIPGALQIDPNARIDDVEAILAGADENLPVVVYCSVGRRSSRLGSRVADDLEGRTVSNLRGGVFAWHNEGRPLENAAGTTPYVHPYGFLARGLVERDEFVATRPKAD